MRRLGILRPSPDLGGPRRPAAVGPSGAVSRRGRPVRRGDEVKMYSRFSITQWIAVALAITTPNVGGAAQNGTCHMDGGKNAHYYCPDGFELVLGGGGDKDCAGRCYKPGAAAALKDAVQGLMIDAYDTKLSEHAAQKATAELSATGKTTVDTKHGAKVDVMLTAKKPE